MVRQPTTVTVRRARWRAAAVVAVCAVAGVIAAVAIVPQHFSNAAATGFSTIFKTATDLTTGSTAASVDSPGGAKSGTARPGDTLKWVVSYENAVDAPATVDLRDTLTTAGTYVAGSLQLPPNPNGEGTLGPQYSADGGATWRAGNPTGTVGGVGFRGTVVPRGTQQRSVHFTTSPSNMIAITGGDAFNAVLYGQRVYAVSHHATGRIVYCAQLDGSICPGWPKDSNLQPWSATVGAPIGTGTSFAGKTASVNATWVGGGKLFWFTGPLDNSSAGLGCLDLSTTVPTSCGYLPRSSPVINNSAIGSQFSGTGVPASDGNIYTAAVNATSTVAIMCVTPLGVQCPGQTIIWSGVTSAYGFNAAAFGDYVFASVQQTTSTTWQTFCYNVKTGLCSPSSWPQPSSPASVIAGTPFLPVLSKTGSLTGVCTVTNGLSTSSQCWNLSGALQAVNPYAGTGANYNAGQGSPGSPWVIGTKVYVSNGDQVMCRDFALYSGTGPVPFCAGFVNVPNVKNYSVRPAVELGKDCLVASADSGQIRFFNAASGGPCTTSAPQSVTVRPADYYCGSGQSGFTRWDTLSLPGLVTGAYANASVTLRDQNGAVLPGYDDRVLAPGAQLDLSGLPASVTALTAEVGINGVSDAAGITSGQIAISWKGIPPQMCFQTTVPPISCDASGPTTLTNTATVVSASTAGTDAPGGNSTGPVSFVAAPHPSQCSLAVVKTSTTQSVRPGGKVGYEITVSNTGTQAYDRAAFTDDLRDVLKEATYNGDHSATLGTVSYAEPELSWSGPLPPGAQAKIVYSVTVPNPVSGDHHLVNTVLSPTPGSNCAAGSADPRCAVTVNVAVTELLWHKVDATAARNALSGSAWTLTPVDGSGRPTGPGTPIVDCDQADGAACDGVDLDPIGGLFRVTDLGPGAYQLVETKAPVGFVLDPTPVPVRIGDTELSITLPDITNRQLPVPLIPLTGGLGTDALTVTGGSLLAIAAALLAWMRFRRRTA